MWLPGRGHLALDLVLGGWEPWGKGHSCTAASPPCVLALTGLPPSPCSGSLPSSLPWKSPATWPALPEFPRDLHPSSAEPEAPGESAHLSP